MPELGDPRRVVFSRTSRRAAKSGTIWGLIFGVYVAANASGYAATYPTVASRTAFAGSLGTNAGLKVLYGPARQIDTVAGYTSWRTMGVLSIIGAMWGLLLATRLTRAEEDHGRWELLLSGQTTAGRAAVQAVTGLLVGLACLWAILAIVVVAVGASPKVDFAPLSTMFLAIALICGAAMFLAIGLLVAQLAANRRQANILGAAVLGGCFLVRMVVDLGSGLAWLRWVNPLGLTEQLHPLTGSDPAALLPIAGFVAIGVLASAGLAARRDLGASVLPSSDSRKPRTRLLSGPFRLTIRLSWGLSAGWTFALGAMGLVMGLVAKSAAPVIADSPNAADVVGRLGGRGLGAASVLGVAFVIAAATLAFAAAGQLGATRSEEADGYLDNLLVRPVARWRWLVARIVTGAALIVVAGLIAGIAAWVGAASQDSGVGVGQLVQAGVNIAPPALFVLGIGCLLYGRWPRLAVPATYALVSWSLLVQLVASVVPGSRLLLDSSVLTHTAPVPAADPNWLAAAWLVGLGVVAAAIGVYGFERRDLASQ